MVHTYTATGTSGDSKTIDNLGERRQVRRRPHPQARGHNPYQSQASRQPGDWSTGFHHRRPLGTPPVPRHHILQQRDIKHTTGATQVWPQPETLAQRLKSKDGRFRHNLTGKRVNYCSRTVVSPDPNISLNDVGVPQIIAKELTVPTKSQKRILTNSRYSSRTVLTSTRAQTMSHAPTASARK